MANLAGEILHAVGVRLRVIGSGNLKSYLRSLDDMNNVQLRDLPLEAATNREPMILANYHDQRIQLELKTTEIDETFFISRIVIFVKPSASGYPIP